MNNLNHGIELEKKFLIEYPDIDALKKYNPVKYEIEQIYLLSDTGSHRIRKRINGVDCEYYETIKVRINGHTCHEYEGVITLQQYEKLKKNADPKKHPVVKSRYAFAFKNKCLELDVYPFWKDKAVLEIELSAEDEPYYIPDEIVILRDVSDDAKYKNSYLASII